MSVRKGSNIIAIGNVQVDGDTTSFNSNHSLQVIGTKNKNTESSVVGIYDWVGTKDEYTEQNVAVLHPDWICFITDDEEMDIDNYYTKTATDDRFAHRDADNFTPAGTTYLSGLGMPSNRRDQVTLLASGTEYTAPANGWWYFTGQLGAGGGTSNQILMYARDFSEGNNLTARVLAPAAVASYPAILPARAGSKLVLNYASTSASPNWLFFFHYAEGNSTNS